MSSTYVHYNGIPSSLPQDYAVLSHYVSKDPRSQSTSDLHPDDAHNAHDTHDPDEHDSFLPSTSQGYSDTLRHTTSSSSTPGFLHPPNPSIGSSPVPVPSETTALIPRIREEVDAEPVNSEHVALREELAVLWKYALPVFGTHALEYSLIIASVIAIGHVSTTALAASTLGSMTASVTAFSIIQGFTSTLDTMLPSAWTSSNPALVGLWSQRMAIVMAVTLIPIYLIWFSAESILLTLKQEPEVARLAGLYLRYLSIGLPAYAFNCIIRRYFQSQGLFAVPTKVIMAVAPVNALLNWLLVWGPEPVRLGFIGAPIATALSFNLISVASLAYAIFVAPHTAWHPLSRRMFGNLGVLVQLGLAGVGQVASEWWSWELVGLAASLLGSTTLATQSVLLVSASAMYQLPFALSVATSVRIGNLLGEKSARRAGVSAKAGMVLALIFAGANSATLLIFRKKWAYLFNDDIEVVTTVASILPLVALFQVFDGMAGVTAGILRARGKQFTGAMINLSAYYVIGIPFGIWLAFRRDMRLEGLWIGLSVALIYASFVSVYLCLKTDWEKEVRKVEARLSSDSDADRKRDDQSSV